MYDTLKEKQLNGRYVNFEQINAILKDLNFDEAKISTVGNSVDGRPILQVKIGQGAKKVLMWSQMHGNESTTTKAVFDLLQFLKADSEEAQLVKKQCTLLILPMLNPDGAEMYTRENANKVDLNRDAYNLSQPESKVLRAVFEEFKPNFCFNLHDQRTMYNVGETDKSATISFLSPSANVEKEVTPSRITSMQLIVAMTRKLNQHISGMIGRYDDTFNKNCVGDTFQSLDIPTILFESGHYPNDYEREKTRMFMYLGIVECLTTIAKNIWHDFDHEEYFAIPENGKRFFDVLIKNTGDVVSRYPSNYSIGIQYIEKLFEGKIIFEPSISDQGNLKGFYGHKTFDCALESDREKMLNKTEILRLIS